MARKGFVMGKGGDGGGGGTARMAGAESWGGSSRVAEMRGGAKAGRSRHSEATAVHLTPAASRAACSWVRVLPRASGLALL